MPSISLDELEKLLAEENDELSEEELKNIEIKRQTKKLRKFVKIEDMGMSGFDH